MIKIIALTGQAGSGKNTAGQYLANRYEGITCAFAEPLYQMLAALLNVDYTELETQLTDRAFKEAPHPALGNRSPRRALQWLGDFVRDRFGRNFLIRQLASRIAWAEDNIPNHYSVMVITDLRTDAEAQWVRAHKGTVIHLHRDAAGTQAKHSTEDGVAMHQGDAYIFNNDTVEELHKRLDTIMAEIALRGAA